MTSCHHYQKWNVNLEGDIFEIEISREAHRLGYQSCPSPSRPNSHTIRQTHTDHYAL